MDTVRNWLSVWKGQNWLASLSNTLDDNRIPWKTYVLGFSAVLYVFEEYLSYRQYKVLHRPHPPVEIKDLIAHEEFEKAQKYSRAKMAFSAISSAYSMVQNIVVIVFDLMPYFWMVTGGWQANYLPARFQGEISHSLLFFAAFNLPSTLLNLPLSIYYTFVLEEKFGFNKQTPKLFFVDFIKGQVLMHVIGGPILAAFLKIVNHYGDTFFYYLWVFFFAIQIVMVTLYPILIQPWFNKLEPLTPGKLKTDIEGLAQRLKFPLAKLFVIDGSKRSSHSNAYFYGLPWSKRIVIFDTLIEKSEPEEVVAVLAHELGHWSMGHTTQGLLIAQVHLFSIFALFSAFAYNGSLYRSFGFGASRPILIGFIIFNDVLQPLEVVLGLLMNIFSRKNEYQADAFAKKLGYVSELSKALIKLQIQNLSSMDADKWYSTYHYSHPILAERLAALGYKGEKAM